MTVSVTRVTTKSENRTQNLKTKGGEWSSPWPFYSPVALWAGTLVNHVCNQRPGLTALLDMLWSNPPQEAEGEWSQRPAHPGKPTISASARPGGGTAQAPANPPGCTFKEQERRFGMPQRAEASWQAARLQARAHGMKQSQVWLTFPLSWPGLLPDIRVFQSYAHDVLPRPDKSPHAAAPRSHWL